MASQVTRSFSMWFLSLGVLKSQVFKAPAPHKIQELKHRIQQEVKRIPMEMLQRVMGDVRKRLTKCLERDGGHLNDAVFGKLDFCFHRVKLLNMLNWNWQKLNSFIYTLCSYVLKLNKWKNLLFMTFLKSPDSLTHSVLDYNNSYIFQPNFRAVFKLIFERWV
jgi:hypothetical protein